MVTEEQLEAALRDLLAIVKELEPLMILIV